MDVLEFFDLSKKFERKIVHGGQTRGHMRASDDVPIRTSYDVQWTHKGQEYAEKYQKEENDKLVEHLHEPDGGLACGGTRLADIEGISTVGTMPSMGDVSSEELTQVYSQFDFSHRSCTTLPIASFKDKIVHMIESNQVTIIQGFTGCGKTTQVPQYILNDHAERSVHCNIIVTQPRRIAAISIAKRVCEERKWELKTVVGYQVGLDNCTSPSTRLTYCTTGVLLQKLIGSKHMNNFTHVILDEVHERDQEMDFTLLVVRKLLRTNSRGVKVILMSATFNVDRFAEYFSVPVLSKLEPAPVIRVEKRRKFDISEFYLEDLAPLGILPEIKADEPGMTEYHVQLIVKLISVFDGIEEEEYRLNSASLGEEQEKAKGSVLVFLPGIHEIEEVFNALQNEAARHRNSKQWWVLPLHSTITGEEQVEVFRAPKPNQRKIILSTNIAESSITVPDTKFVIDTCLTKQLICDVQTNFTSLQVCWAAKTNCVQRGGRVGRVSSGRVYRLIPKEFYENIIEEEGKPEMLRCPLARLILQTKLLDMGEPRALLALALDPPDLCNIEKTILLLKECGALLMTCHERPSMYDGDITFLGRVMAKLPLDVQVSRLVVLGYVFGVLKECIIIGSAMSLKSIFSMPFKERLNAYQSKLSWADSSCSDCIAFYNAYNVWLNHHRTGYFKRSTVSGGERGWGRRSYIQVRAIREIDALVKDVTTRLKHVGIEEEVGESKLNYNPMERSLVLKIVLAGAFYPNYFVRGAQGGQVDEQEAVKTLVGRDPFSTVFLQGMPMNQPGKLYTKTIKEILKDCSSEMKVSFDGTSKIYVQFPRYPEIKSQNEMEEDLSANIPGRIVMPVYKAIKLRQLRIPITLHLLPPEKAQQRAKQLGLFGKRGGILEEEDTTLPTVQLPGIDTTSIQIQITHVIDPGHFWANYKDDATINLLLWMDQVLNRTNEAELRPIQGPIHVGQMYIAPYTEDSGTNYYRARVESILPRQDKELLVQVFFMDYGNTEEMCASKLYDIGDDDVKKQLMEIPAQAFECVLAGIRPSVVRSNKGHWCAGDLDTFKWLIERKNVFGRVYSVVHSVVSMELIVHSLKPSRHPNEVNVNQWLIQKKIAECAEESYLSKKNHSIRLQHAELEPEQKISFEQQQLASDKYHKTVDPDPPARRECKITVNLRGPHSPLEMKIYSLTRAGSCKDVMIEWNSVNSVLLDTDPQDPHERMLVAACVGQNAQGDRLTLRHTTMMPNIHGLSSLICLLFAPVIELRTNPSRTMFTGALCGLGSVENGNTPLFPDHDMEVNFDAEITIDDIQDVNRLRFWINCMLHTEEGEEVPNTGVADIIKCQSKIKEFLFNLLERRRESMELQLPRHPFEWNQINPVYLLDPCDSGMSDRSILRLHWAVELQVEEDEHVRSVTENLQQLRLISTCGSKQNFQEVKCILCDSIISTFQELSLHLHTSFHRTQEQEFKRMISEGE